MSSAWNEEDAGIIRQTASWCGWILLMLPALAVAAFSVFFNTIYGIHLAGSDADMQLAFASGFLSADCFKVALPILGGLAWRSGYRPFAALL